ncbi:hypothetical protein OROHE_017586 [Orobanche hederae]
METPGPALPTRHTALCLDIKGHSTDIVVSSYEDYFLVMATQIGSMGTILHARKEEGVSVDPTYAVSVVFGKRDEPMLVACARQLIEHISNSGSRKALVLSLGLRDHSMDMLKGIVSAVIEKLVEQRPRRDRVIHPNGEHDLSVEYPDIDDDKTVMKLHKEQKKHTERENMDRRNLDQNDKDLDTEDNGDITMPRLSDKKKSVRKVEDFGGTYLASFDDKDALKSTYSYEFSFCEKVKERLHSAGDYHTFLKCLHIYNTKFITRKELKALVDDLLGKYPDLMEGFNEFLDRCERIDGFLAGVIETLCNEGNSSKALRIDEKE